MLYKQLLSKQIDTNEHPEHAAKQREVGFRTKIHTFHSYDRHADNIRISKVVQNAAAQALQKFIVQ